MKSPYSKPKIEVILLHSSDIICTSGGTTSVTFGVNVNQDSETLNVLF